MTEQNTTYTPSLRQSIAASVVFVTVLWCIKSAEILFGWSLYKYGLYPGEISGLIGIITGPLIHGSLEHISGNSLALFLLISAIFYGYPVTKYRVIILVWLFSGLGTWLFARESYHFGASGLTHGLFFYLLTISILRRDKRSILLMMIAFFLYGGMLMSIFPREEGISFEYHFFGAVVGFIAAIIYRKVDPLPVEKKYRWETHPNEDDETIGDEWQMREERAQEQSTSLPEQTDDSDYKEEPRA